MMRFLIQFILFTFLTTFTALQAVAEDSFKQIELTEDQVVKYIKAYSALNDVFERIDKAGDKPDPELMEELETIARKHDFKSFEHLDLVAQNIAFIMTGYNPESGKFVEPRVAINDEIASLRKDQDIPENERKKLIGELEEIAQITPEIKFKSNVELLKKYVKQLDSLGS